MNQRRFWSLALTATISTLAIPVIARAQVSIEELQRSGAGITVSGEVTSVVGNDFVLDDGTGQLIVDAGPNWWHQIDISEGEEVTVTGELGRGGELDAYSITRSDGSTIEIRSPGGPPPWAGDPNRHRQRPNP
jgi:hypothetical protein